MVTAISTVGAYSALTLATSATFTAGAATLNKAFTPTVQWTPKFPATEKTGDGGPGAWMHAREVDLLFRAVYFPAATVTFSTDLYPTGTL